MHIKFLAVPGIRERSAVVALSLPDENLKLNYFTVPTLESVQCRA